MGHVPQLLLPALLEKVPAAHKEQPVLPTAENCPGTHAALVSTVETPSTKQASPPLLATRSVTLPSPSATYTGRREKKRVALDLGER